MLPSMIYRGFTLLQSLISRQLQAENQGLWLYDGIKCKFKNIASCVMVDE